ncbi:MAG: DUF3429 domain-containing protein [Aestuariivirgaceae bacterium]
MLDASEVSAKSAMMETIPRAALWLGVAGALPFWIAALSFFTGIGMTEGQSLAVALAYGGLMLSFLGGIRWGVALGAPDERQRARAMIGGAMPVLAGLAAFFLAPPIGLSLIIIALFVQALADVMSADRGALPGWFGRLRALLTVLAVIPVIFILTGILAG